MIPYYEKRTTDFVSTVNHLTFFPPHLHEHLELISVRSGTAHITINGEDLHLQPNDFAIAFPNAIHGYLSASEDCTTQMFICSPRFAGEYWGEMVQHQPIRAVIRATDVHPDMAYALRALAQESATPGNAQVQKALLQLIFARMLQQLPLKKTNSPLKESLMHRVMLYVCAHFQEPLSLATLATALGASKYDISRVFSNKIGISFNDYINNLRIDLAKQLLLTHAYSMLEVSNICGFDTQRSFNRAFKYICNATPREYQAQHSSGKNNATPK